MGKVKYGPNRHLSRWPIWYLWALRAEQGARRIYKICSPLRLLYVYLLVQIFVEQTNLLLDICLSQVLLGYTG